jgi:flap endonuclease-1
MGVDIKALLIREKTNLESFSSKIIAIDAYNAIYQFLAIIRGPEGLHLTDNKGRVTSHLTGLLYRNVNFLSIGIKPVYVFDGKPPSLKTAEIQRRKLGKKEATIKYEKSKAIGDFESERKYAQQKPSMQDTMVEDSKHLLDLFGIPYVQAKADGEATAAYMNKTGMAYAVASQDYDSVLFGAKKLVRNFTNSGRRKLPNRNTYIDIEPEMISYQKSLDALGITGEQIIDIGILVGTDFNPDGFERIGPKTALKMIKEYGKLEDIPKIQDELKEIDYRQIRKIFLQPDIQNIGEIEFKDTDYSGIVDYLANERSFSQERVQSSLNRLKKCLEKRSHTLDQWFK